VAESTKQVVERICKEIDEADSQFTVKFQNDVLEVCRVALRAEAPSEPTAAPPIYGHHCPTGEHTDKRCCQACDHDYPVECVCDEVAEHYAPPLNSNSYGQCPYCDGTGNGCGCWCHKTAPPPERATRTAEELQAIDADVDEILGKRAADDVTSVLARVQRAFRALRPGETR
jgi:hypothetical protein